MTGSARQLILDLPHEPRYSREDFLVAGSNREAMAALDAWPNWPGRMLLLAGPPGSGKTHLGAIWAARAHAARLGGEALAGADLLALAAAEALLIDDADRLGAAEAALFHLVNLVRESGAYLLLTATSAPDLWGLQKADLLSRLRLAPLVALSEPDESLARAVLVKLFEDRQLRVEPSVVDYLVLRIERSLAAARAVVAALDREALARGRAVTRPMAAALLRDTENET